MSDESLLESAIGTAREAAQDHIEVVRRELARPWDEGSRDPGAETGRWLGLGLTLSALAIGLGLAVHTVFGKD